MKRRTFWTIIREQFWEKRLNRVGAYFIFAILLLVVLGPFLANSKPYYYTNSQGRFFPILEDVPLINSFVSYPDLKGINFRKEIGKEGVDLLMPPIPYSDTEYDLDSILLPPSDLHLMGTDVQGRDVAARMIYGAQVSVLVGLVSVVISFVLGVIFGGLAGFFGGKWDMLISRFIEIVMCFPTFLLILTILAVLEPKLIYIMLAIGFTGWTGIARLVRGEFLKLRDQEFVIGARALGAHPLRMAFKHMLPNAMSPVLVSLTFGVASSMLIESSLSFLGFGVQPPTPSWGQILSSSRDFMDIAWWLMFFPGVAIFLTVTAFNLVGEGLRDAVDPRAE